MRKLSRIRNSTSKKIEVTVEPWADVFLIESDGFMDLSVTSNEASIEVEVKSDDIVVFIEASETYEFCGNGVEQV